MIVLSGKHVSSEKSNENLVLIDIWASIAYITKQYKF